MAWQTLHQKKTTSFTQLYNCALSQIQFLISLCSCIYQTPLEDMKKDYLLTELFWKIHDTFNFYHQQIFLICFNKYE